MGERGDRIEFADALRGISCCCVVAAHLLSLYWTDTATMTRLIGASQPVSVSVSPYLAKLAVLVPYLNLGPLGVALFFLISGFVIPISLTRYSRPGFVIARAFRLAPTYFVCFAISMGAVAIVVRFYGSVFPHSLEHLLVHSLPGLRMLLGTPVIDPVIWSLEIEIIFYMLCALAASWLRCGSLRFLVLPVGVFAFFFIAAEAHWWRAFFYAPYLIFMFIGTAIYFHWKGHITSLAAGGVVIGLLVLAGAAHWRVGGAALVPIGVAYPLAIGMFISCYLLRDRFRPNRILRWLSGVSYPLYVVHALPGFAVLHTLVSWGLPPDAAIVCAVSVVMLLAYLVHRFVEQPTQAMGARFARAVTAKAADWWSPITPTLYAYFRNPRRCDPVGGGVPRNPPLVSSVAPTFVDSQPRLH